MRLNCVYVFAIMAASLGGALVLADAGAVTTTSELLRRHCANMTEANQVCGQKIAFALENEWGIADADCLPSMWLHDIQEVIEAAGGNKRWALALEYKLATPFKRLPTNEPPSAILALGSAGPIGSDTGVKVSSEGRGASANYKLGPKVARGGNLASNTFTADELEGCLISTRDPKKQKITKPEKANILQYIYNWRIRRKSAGRDHLLFQRVLLPVLEPNFPHIPGAPWAAALNNSAGNRSRVDITVRHPTSLRAHLAHCAKAPTPSPAHNH